MFFVDAASADEYVDVVFEEVFFIIFYCGDNSFKGSGDVGEVGDAASDDEFFVGGVVREPFFEDERAVLEDFIFGWVSAVFSVVEEVFVQTAVDDSVGEEDACAAAGDEGEDISVWIEDFKFEAGAAGVI